MEAEILVIPKINLQALSSRAERVHVLFCFVSISPQEWNVLTSCLASSVLEAAIYSQIIQLLITNKQEQIVRKRNTQRLKYNCNLEISFSFFWTHSKKSDKEKKTWLVEDVVENKRVRKFRKKLFPTNWFLWWENSKSGTLLVAPTNASISIQLYWTASNTWCWWVSALETVARCRKLGSTSY